MKLKIHPPGLVAWIAVTVILTSCDSFPKIDFIKPSLEPSHYYTTTNKSILIDLTPLSFRMDGPFEIYVTGVPERGTVTLVRDLLYRYDPDNNLDKGTDQITFAITRLGKILARQIATIHVVSSVGAFPCGVTALHDKVKVTESSIATINPLENDHICGTNPGSIAVSLYTDPEHGQAIVQGQSVVYTAGSSFKGYDEFIYALKSPATDSIAYGLISVADYATIRTREVAGDYTSTSFFLDDETGFMASDSRIFKTTDGGLNWNVTGQYPSGSSSFCYDLLFLDTHHGFAAYGWDGLASTTDGGETWKKSSFEAGVAAVSFTSPNTGFVALLMDGGDFPPIRVLKTNDAGATWNEVVSGITSMYGFLNIHFIDEETGYIQLSDRILATTDGGEHWHSILESEWINYFTVTPENDVFAILSENNTVVNKWSNGGPWKKFAKFNSYIHGVRFSPSGKVGFAVTHGEGQPLHDNPHLQPLSIVRTIDGGSTWTAVRLEEPIYGSPSYLQATSDEVLYIHCSDRIIRCSLD